jgi:hypothetical protein
MGESIRALRNLAKRDRTARSHALMDEADAHPEHGVSQFVAAVNCWEEGDLANARRFAERVLRDDPHAFRMLVICVDYHQQAGDIPRAYELAKRLLAAENPARSIRRIAPFLGSLFWVFNPSRWRKWRLTNMQEADTFDAWVEWAQRYVQAYDGGTMRSGT